MTLRIVMMGTGSFALPTFLGLCEGRHQVVALCTQPDRSGRGHHRHRHPLKEAAVERDVVVLQPSNVNTAAALDELRALEPDLCVVAAYGQILSPDMLSIPRRGAINLHASILPKYRGAAPVPYAILAGETETGVTVFQIEPKLDAGPMLGVATTPIGAKETAGDVTERLAQLAVPLAADVVDQIEAGTVTRTSQDPQQVTLAPRLRKADGAIDWTQPAAQISRHVRAMQPWPNPFTFFRHAEGEPLRLILLDTEPVESAAKLQPGEPLATEDARLLIGTGEGVLEILRLRPQGRRDMTAAEFLHGHAVGSGDRLSSPSE